jgi:hypothetical protein
MKTRYITSAIALLSILAAPLQAQAVRNDTPPATEPSRPVVPIVTTTADLPAPLDDDVVYLNRFEVVAAVNRGYYAPTTLAGSRINTKLEDVGSAITVITPEFLRDTGAVDNLSLLSYTPSTEVAGMLGNMRGVSDGAEQDQTGSFTNPNGNTRVRGLTSADGTRNFFRSSIPWDGYNVERIDMQRGPSAILFGLGSPAGIINETSKTAQHKNSGSFEFRYGSYGTNRISLDYNQNLLKNELSVRLNLMRNDQQYRQDPAYSLDKRVAAAVRYDPKWANSDNIKTTLKVNYEAGRIKSNNPRSITPSDLITQWWTPGTSAAGYKNLDHQGYNPALVANSAPFYRNDGTEGYYIYQNADQSLNQGQFNKAWSASGTSATYPNGVPFPNSSSVNPNYAPWLNTLDKMAGGMWIVTSAGQVVPSAGMMPETNSFPYAIAIQADGTTTTNSNQIGGIPVSRRVSVASRNFWGSGAHADPTDAPYGSFGVWKTDTLTDASLFDFYNNLLEGDNKQEWQSFNDISAFLNQSFFKNKLGYELAYDHQNLSRGQYSFDGVLYVDINKYNIDGVTPNPHYGEPYIQTSNIYGNNSTKIEIDSARFTAFFDHDFNEGKRNWLTKLLGRHTLTGLFSTETYDVDNRDFSRYALGTDAIGLMSTNTIVSEAYRQLVSTIYLGPSLANAATYQGAHIPRAGGKVQVPGTTAWTYFDSHWNAPGVDPAAEWINSWNGSISTQAENPANYVGMTTTDVSILSAENNRAELTRSGALSRRTVQSMALSWQASLWDGAIVGLYGLRQDHVVSKSLTSVVGKVIHPDYGTVIFDNYNLNDPALVDRQVMTKNSTSWSVVAKLNRFLNGKLPINVNLYYNQSDNFQIPDTMGNDVYGNPHPVPTGKTKEMGVLLSTKDSRYVLKVNKYETSQKNVVNNGALNNNTWYFFDARSSGPDQNFIGRGENRIDQYQYHLSARANEASAAIVYLDDPQPETLPWDFGLASSGDFRETQEHSNTTRMATVAAWRALTNEPFMQKILDTWGYDLSGSTGAGLASTPVANFGATRDQISKGWEVEFTANPLRNWRISLNAAYTKATNTNVGGPTFTEFVTNINAYYNKRLILCSPDDPGAMTVNDGVYRNGTLGQAYSFRWATDTEIQADMTTTGPDGKSLLTSPANGGAGNDLYNNTFAGIGGFNMWNASGSRSGANVSWNSNFYAHYSLLKLLEGNYSTELRPWRVNVITSYDFTTGGLKGLTIGGGWRWQDKNVIGYPVILLPIEPGVRSAEAITFDVDHPYYGPSLSSYDFWIAYQRKLGPKLTWRIQLNVRDAFAGKKLIPLTTQYDGTVAAWGIAPSQTWVLTNTFMF